MVVQQQSLNNLSAEQLREMVASLMGRVTDKDAQIHGLHAGFKPW